MIKFIDILDCGTTDFKHVLLDNAKIILQERKGHVYSIVMKLYPFTL